MTFEERVKLETKLALQELLEAKTIKEKEDDEDEEEKDEDGNVVKKKDEEDDDVVEESLLAAVGTIAVGATVIGIGKLVDNMKKRSRERELLKQVDKVLPNLSQNIMRIRQRAKMLNSANDIDSFESATTAMKRDITSAIRTVKSIELSEDELNSLSWKIQSPEKRLEKFRSEIVWYLEGIVSDLEDLEVVAMQELNAKLGL